MTLGVGLDSVRGHLDLAKCSSSPLDSTVEGSGAADLEDVGFFEDEAALFLLSGREAAAVFGSTAWVEGTATTLFSSG